MPYVSTLRSPTRGSQSSGRMARPRARRPGHGTERSKGEPVPRLLLSSCLCPKPAFSPEGPQLKIKTYINMDYQFGSKVWNRLLQKVDSVRSDG